MQLKQQVLLPAASARPRVVQSASWQSASWRIRELSSYQTEHNETASAVIAQQWRVNFCVVSWQGTKRTKKRCKNFPQNNDLIKTFKVSTFETPSISSKFLTMCWQQTGHGKIDPAMGQFSKRLSVIIIDQLVERSNIVLTRVIDNTSLHAAILYRSCLFSVLCIR